MNYLSIKKEVLELKLRIIELQLKKKTCIREQRYELAADIRENERNLLLELEEYKRKLNDELAVFDKKKEGLKTYYELLSTMSEITIFHFAEESFNEPLHDLCTLLKLEFENLFEKKKACFAAHQFKEAGDINEQIIAIGRFLASYGK